MIVPARARSKISLVLADVDGTLVTAEKVLTSRASAAVKALHAAGIAFAITSGPRTRARRSATCASPRPPPRGAPPAGGWVCVPPGFAPTPPWLFLKGGDFRQ